MIPLVAFLLAVLIGSVGRTSAEEAGSAADARLGRIRALSVVGAVSAERMANTETEMQKRSGEDLLVAGDLSQSAPRSLSSRLEAIAGSVGLFNFSGVSKQAAFFAEARYRLTESVQFGASAALRYQGSERGSDAAAQILFGPTINFVGEAGLQNAFFISPKIGPTLERTVVDGAVVDSSLRLSLSLSGGKRFALSDRIAYTPSIGVVKDLGANTNFVVQPVAFSIFF